MSGSAPPFARGFLHMAMNEEIFKAQEGHLKSDQIGPDSPVPRLTAQEQMYVRARVAGASMREAARRSGYNENYGSNLEKRPHISTAIDYYTEEFEQDILPRVRFTKDDAHHMYMNAYRSAGSSMEMTRATDSLVKLHKLNEPEKPNDIREVNSMKQLENMSAADLLRLSGMDLTSLRPDTDVVDGEYEVEDGQ